MIDVSLGAWGGLLASIIILVIMYFLRKMKIMKINIPYRFGHIFSHDNKHLKKIVMLGLMVYFFASIIGGILFVFIYNLKLLSFLGSNILLQSMLISIIYYLADMIILFPLLGFSFFARKESSNAAYLFFVLALLYGIIVGIVSFL